MRPEDYEPEGSSAPEDVPPESSSVAPKAPAFSMEELAGGETVGTDGPAFGAGPAMPSQPPISFWTHSLSLLLLHLAVACTDLHSQQRCCWFGSSGPVHRGFVLQVT
jgi:hypothetical protein